MSPTTRILGAAAGAVLLGLVIFGVWATWWLIENRTHQYEILFGVCAMALLFYIAYVAILTIYVCLRA